MPNSCSFPMVILLAAVFAASFLSPLTTPSHAAGDTLIVTAEGLADPNAEAYKRDKGLLYDALLDDARRQAIEKVVGVFVDSHSLVENYMLIEDSVLSQSHGYIKQIIHQSDPWLGKDGFMHLQLKAEVYTGKAENALRDMGRLRRIDLIRKAGNPRITVAINVRDYERNSETKPMRSPIAENILKEHISAFGYRVWSEGSTGSLKKTADFAIQGEVKFKPVNLKLKTSGIEINKISITSWTVKCLDSITGEELYFNNKIPSRRSWNSEDAAVEAIGKLIGEEFSEGFFNQQLLKRTRTYELAVQGLPVYDAATLFKNELIGLRPILNVDLRTFDEGGQAFYEVEFSGSELNFSEYLNSGVIVPLNNKFGKRTFSLASVNKLQVKIKYKGTKNPDKLINQFKGIPPSSLTTAAPERLNQIAATKETLQQISEVNPQGAKQVAELRKSGGR